MMKHHTRIAMTAALIIVLDQIGQHLIAEPLQQADVAITLPLVFPWLSVTYGQLPGYFIPTGEIGLAANGLIFATLWTFVLIGALWLYTCMSSKPSLVLQAGVGCILGAALATLLALAHGLSMKFLRVGPWEGWVGDKVQTLASPWAEWNVLNVADISFLLGVALIVLAYAHSASPKNAAVRIARTRTKAILNRPTSTSSIAPDAPYLLASATSRQILAARGFLHFEISRTVGLEPIC